MTQKELDRIEAEDNAFLALEEVDEPSEGLFDNALFQGFMHLAETGELPDSLKGLASGGF